MKQLGQTSLIGIGFFKAILMIAGLFSGVTSLLFRHICRYQWQTVWATQGLDREERKRWSSFLF
jgi:hypothetical protein